MVARLIRANTTNAYSSTLNGSITSDATTVTLTSVTGLTAPGVLVLDRQDGSNNNTPAKREFISYTGISGNDLTTVTRAIAGSTGQSHSSGALVEEVFSITHWNDLYDFLIVSHDLAGKLVTSTATITTHLMASGASVIMTDTTINRYLSASGASIVGTFPLHPVFAIPGFSSAASTNVAPLVIMPAAGSWQSFTVVSRTPVSTASLTIDINKNFVSIFDTIGRPNILGAGTFNSTASIATKAFARGDTFSVDVDTGGSVADISVIGRGKDHPCSSGICNLNPC